MGDNPANGELSERLLPEEEGGVSDTAAPFDPNGGGISSKGTMSTTHNTKNTVRKQAVLIAVDFVVGAYSIAVALVFAVNFSKEWTLVPTIPGSNDTALLSVSDSNSEGCGQALVLNAFSVPVVAWCNCTLHILLQLVVVLLMSEHFAAFMERHGYPGSKLLNSGKIDVSAIVTLRHCNSLSADVFDVWHSFVWMP
jgi:hypothetical protein